MNKKSWRQKRDKVMDGYPKIVDITEKWNNSIAPGKMVILTPTIINEYLNKIPRGKLTTIALIRELFAAEFNVDTTCPLTTGIFVWICAGAAEEDRANGKETFAPYWRVLKEGGKLNPKFPGGVVQQANLLSEEGFEVIPGKKETSWKVKNFEKYCL